MTGIHSFAEGMDPIFTQKMNEERASAIKQFTNGFQFTRQTLGKGIKYMREKNMFLAR